MKKALAMVLILLLLLTSCTKGTQESQGPELVLRYADNQSDDYPTTVAARHFADLVKERTNGRIEIEVYGGGVLGDETNVLRQLIYGGIDFMRISTGIFSVFYPSYAIFNVPYLFRDSAHMWAVLDGEIGDELLHSVNEKELVALAWFDAGVRSIYSSKPIFSLSDMQGLTIRTLENDRLSSMMEKTGAKAVHLPYSDVYSELQKKNIDGAENNFPSYVSTGHVDLAPYYFVDEHLRLAEVMLMGAKTRETIRNMDEHFLDIIYAAAKETGLMERELWNEEEEKAKRVAISRKALIIYPSEEEKAHWEETMTFDENESLGELKTLIERIKNVR